MALNEAQIAVALSEQAYRRATADQQLTDKEIGVTAVSSLLAVGSLREDGTSAFYYNDATGFVGHVVQAGNTVSSLSVAPTWRGV